jgi:hypothetical protein
LKAFALAAFGRCASRPRPFPVIALVNGYALAAARPRWRATGSSPESAQFGQPEVNLGICPGFGGTQPAGWSARHGDGIVRHRPPSRPPKRWIGLVNHAVPAAGCWSGLNWRDRRYGPVAVGIVGHLIQHGQDLDETRAAGTTAVLCATGDKREGTAFQRKLASPGLTPPAPQVIGQRKPSRSSTVSGRIRARQPRLGEHLQRLVDLLPRQRHRKDLRLRERQAGRTPG